MFRLSFAILTMFGLSACDSDLAVSSANKQGPLVAGFDRLSAKGGEEIEVNGDHLNSDISVRANDRPAIFRLRSTKEATVVLPLDIEQGLIQITFIANDKAIATLPLMNADSVDTLSTWTVPMESICSSIIFKNGSGDLVQGRGNCGAALNTCVRDGQIKCLTTDDLPAVSKASLSQRIKSGFAAAGVSGTADANLLGCDQE